MTATRFPGAGSRDLSIGAVVRDVLATIAMVVVLGAFGSGGLLGTDSHVESEQQVAALVLVATRFPSVWAAADRVRPEASPEVRRARHIVVRLGRRRVVPRDSWRRGPPLLRV